MIDSKASLGLMCDVVDVTSDGAIRLGSEVTCDGFIRDSLVRVQTHVHTDHMHDFTSSKGFQDVVSSEQTYRLLCAIENADLPYRVNFRPLESGLAHSFGGSGLTLMPNDHMLGSVQVAVDLPNGCRVGYSGDFTWPMDQVMEVDVLVVDATYGSPNSIRYYSQADAEQALISLVQRHLTRGPVHLLAHRGTLQRATQVISGALDCPILGSQHQVSEAQVYRDGGYAIAEILDVDLDEAREVLAEGRYVRLFGTGDRQPTDPGSATTIRCSAYMTRPDSPIVEYSDRAYSVALSNHADFVGTLEYVRATGATTCVTDNARGPHGVTLALELSARLGVEARASSNEYDRSWGR